MAGTRSKPKSGDYYAWSNIYHGGETEVRKSPNGVERKITVSRNIVKHGEPITQSQIKASDDEWENMIAGGSVRPYPVPEGADEHTSPHRAVMATLVDENGDIDTNKLLQLGAPSVAALTTLPNPINPPAEEGKTIGEDKPSGA